MKKIISLILVLCIVLTFAACANKESDAPEITLQEVYDAGKSPKALLGDHESVHILITSNGNVIQEEYLNKQYFYSFYGAEYMDLGFEYASLITDSAEYYNFGDTYTFNITITPNGIVDMKEYFDIMGSGSFISSTMLDDTATIIEKDGSIIVTSTADMDEIAVIGEGVVSCEESYTLDAKTREMTSVKTVYTFEDGSVEEGVITITRDAEMPEGMKPFLAYEQETENMRTVTIVSNPGAENEKTESIQMPKGLEIGISPDWDIEEPFSLYADSACTQTFEEYWDLDSDLSIYIKWGE